jgi:hypothetical protein
MKQLYDEIITGLFDGVCVGFLAYIIMSVLGFHNEFLLSSNTIYPLPLGDLTTMLNCFLMGGISGILLNTLTPMCHFTTFEANKE